MANRPVGYGYAAESVGKEMSAKFDADSANLALEWIVGVLQTGSSEDQQLASEIGKVETEKDVHTPLKNGVILCHLVNIIKPDLVKKIDTTSNAFKPTENVSNFLTACEDLGVRKMDLFVSSELIDSNIPKVIGGIVALARHTQKLGSDLPTCGPKEAASKG